MRVDRQESLPSSVEQFDEGCQSGMFQDVAKVADVGELLVASHFGSECRLKAILTSRALVTLLTRPSAFHECHLLMEPSQLDSTPRRDRRLEYLPRTGRWEYKDLAVFGRLRPVASFEADGPNPPLGRLSGPEPGSSQTTP